MSAIANQGSYTVKALDLQVNEGEHEVVAVISSSVIDRDGDIVLPSGLAKKQYQGLKIFKNHDYSEDPNGVIKWVKRDGENVVMKAKFFAISPEQQLNWEFVKHGVYDQWSIGFKFNPDTASPPTPQELRKNPEWAAARRVIREWEPYEVSFVGIPANQETMTLAVSKQFSEVAIKALKVELETAAQEVEPEQAAEEIVKAAISKEDLLRALAKQLRK